MPNVFRTMAAALQAIIDGIADQADDLLADARKRAQGRAAIEEFLTLEHAELGPVDRKKVVERVMAILDHEDFFDAEFVGDPFAADESEEEA